MVCASNANTWEDPWSSLTSQYNLTSELQAQRETLSQKTRQASIDGDTDVDLCCMPICTLADCLDAVQRRMSSGEEGRVGKMKAGPMMVVALLVYI